MHIIKSLHLISGQSWTYLFCIDTVAGILYFFKRAIGAIRCSGGQGAKKEGRRNSWAMRDAE